MPKVRLLLFSQATVSVENQRVKESKPARTEESVNLVLRPATLISRLILMPQRSWRTAPSKVNLVGSRLVPFQSDCMGDVVEFLPADLVQRLALGLELLVDLDGLFGHLLVRFLGPTHQGKVGSGGDTLVSIGIQAHA